MSCTIIPLADPRLERWRANVGPVVTRPATFDAGQPETGWRPGSAPPPLVVVSWNVWMGRGRLVDLLTRVRAGEYARLGAPAGAPLAVLVQEAYRAGTDIPRRTSNAAGMGLGRGFGVGEDILDVAHRLGLGLCYVPSMRNGPHASDRGNAILSSLPLEDACAVELPLAVQRRVAVAATVALPDVRGGSRRVRLVSAHLDPRGRPGLDWLGFGGRRAQAAHLLEALAPSMEGVPCVLGADLNLARGHREPAWARLEAAGFGLGLPPRAPLWTHTYHALPKLVIDYLLVRDPEDAVARMDVHRLDEHPHDAGRTVFGSDHHPLLGTLEPR